MEQAKKAASDFLSKGGHQSTTVHESVAPSVQSETIREQQQEHQQVVKDREIHQDHYHTTVQPVKDREVLPERHHHNLAGVEHRTFDHRNDAETKEKLHAEHGKFQNRTHHESSDHTTTTAVPEIGSDRVHHHIHEVVQPVVHKETIEPHVVHTTVPIHETHYNAPKHHTSSDLPAISMSEFQKQGGSLTGRDEKVHRFTGEPNDHHFDATRDLRPEHQQGHQKQDSVTGATGTHTSGAQGNKLPTEAYGTKQSTDAYGTNQATDSYGTKQSTNVHGNNRATDAYGTQQSAAAHDFKNPVAGQDSQHSTDTHATHKKPSLLDKLNPLKDADGDGKKGFLD